MVEETGRKQRRYTGNRKHNLWPSSLSHSPTWQKEGHVAQKGFDFEWFLEVLGADSALHADFVKISCLLQTLVVKSHGCTASIQKCSENVC